MDGGLPLNRLSAPLRRANAVLRARSRAHFVKEFAGPLSIKSVTEGIVAWKCAGRDRLVDRDSFLVLNADEPYSMAIDSRTPVATLCVFFEDGFVESVQASIARGGIESESAPLPFLGGLHQRDERILPRMRAIEQSSYGESPVARPAVSAAGARSPAAERRDAPSRPIDAREPAGHARGIISPRAPRAGISSCHRLRRFPA